MKISTRKSVVLAAALFCVVVAWALQTATRAVRARAAAPTSMASMLPQGALLTIESPNFAALLKSWNTSAEQKAWLTSANYSVFSNSRLFSRLNDARTEFESAASAKAEESVGIDGNFLDQVAGSQSIFAWYDVGNLEFLYITRMSPAQAAATALMKQRTGFSRRQAGATTFYLRHSKDAESGTTRTVAFAQVPDGGRGALLVLSTREDLIANALQLMDGTHSDSLSEEPWYMAALAGVASSSGRAPELHMVLNLDRIVPLPAFRTYWVQQNITEMKQYRAAVSDLYRETVGGASQFREERALLLRSPDAAGKEADLSSLSAIAPTTGVFRTIATHDPTTGVTALQEKLLGRVALEEHAATAAPDPSLAAPQSGSAGDLETYIDTPPPVSAKVSNEALVQMLKATGFDSVLTYSTALPPSASHSLWIPIHSVVVLHGSSAWNPESVKAALQQSLRGDLTTSAVGIEFHAETNGGSTIFSLTGPKPLFFAVPSDSMGFSKANLCFVSDDRTLLLMLLDQARTIGRSDTKMKPAATTLIAGFDHSGQRGPYARLTALIDGTNQPATGSQPSSEDGPDAPPYFSGNVRSLSDSFAALASEHIVVRRDGAIVRQTVTYQWQKP